jgi:hypothetical protein
MEDLIGDAKPSSGDWVSGRQGSKVFINRLLETNAVPVIWTTNALGNVDAAILRRMSFVLKLDLPSPGTARQMLGRIAAEEGVALIRDGGADRPGAGNRHRVARGGARRGWPMMSMGPPARPMRWCVLCAAAKSPWQ